MIRVGTDCSGIEAPIQALMKLNIPFHHAFSCERDEYCQQSIMANYDPSVCYSDMMDRDVSTLPDIDVYVCGFPCQPFSSAGKRQGLDDEKGRGELFWYCLEVIREKMPSCFILENVKGLITIDEGNTFTRIIKELEDSNYDVYWKVLNTKDYGIPQQRERLYIVGIRSDLKNKFKFEWPESKRSKPLFEYVDVNDDQTEDIPDFIKRSGVLRRIPKDAVFIDIGFPNRSFINSNVECPCITTQANVWCVPMQRRANVKECLRLQGFPVSFKQVVSDRQMKRQIGNSMSVNVLMAIFNQLFPKLEK